MNIDVKIIFNEPTYESFTYNEETKTLHVAFKSFQNLRNFINSPHTIDLVEEAISCYASPREIAILTKVQKDINKNISQFCQKIAESDIFVTGIESISNTDFENMLDNKTVIDISLISLVDTINFLTSHNFGSNVTFIDKYNSLHESTQNELLNTYAKIHEMVENIKDKNLSPAEVIMYIYDFVRARVYKKSNDDASACRDLSAILKNDSIVCLGFANLFASLANSLGIESEVIGWNPKNEDEHGHASVLVYLNDSKHNIKGIYAFDPTFDSKKNEDDKDYVNKCPYAFIPFAHQISYMDRCGFILEYSNIYSKFKNRLNRLIRLKNLNSPDVILSKEKSMTIEALQIIYKKLGLPLDGIDMTLSIDEIVKIINSLDNLQCTIKYSTLINILTKVREVENSINPSLYSNKPEDIEKVAQTNLSYKKYLQEQEAMKKLLRTIFDL